MNIVLLCFYLKSFVLAADELSSALAGCDCTANWTFSVALNLICYSVKTLFFFLAEKLARTFDRLRQLINTLATNQEVAATYKWLLFNNCQEGSTVEED